MRSFSNQDKFICKEEVRYLNIFVMPKNKIFPALIIQKITNHERQSFKIKDTKIGGQRVPLPCLSLLEGKKDYEQSPF